MWTREGFVRKRTDGTWLNGFSVYNQRVSDLHGLQRRLYADNKYSGGSSFILIEPPGDMMIECVQAVPHVPMVCTMSAEYEKGLMIEISFDPVHLPHWKDLKTRTEAFVRPKITFGEQTPLGF